MPIAERKISLTLGQIEQQDVYKLILASEKLAASESFTSLILLLVKRYLLLFCVTLLNEELQIFRFGRFSSFFSR